MVRLHTAGKVWYLRLPSSLLRYIIITIVSMWLDLFMCKLCSHYTTSLLIVKNWVSWTSETTTLSHLLHQQINKRLCTSGVQYVAVVVNKMSILVILCSTPIRTKAWGFVVDAAGRLLLLSPMPAAPSLACLIPRSSPQASRCWPTTPQLDDHSSRRGGRHRSKMNDGDGNDTMQQ